MTPPKNRIIDRTGPGRWTPGGYLGIDDVISLISLRANDEGVGYNFGELWPGDTDRQT